MSEFRIEKRRAQAALTLTTGAVVRGCFFLAGSRATHAGPERVADLLNAGDGFFPFELNGEAAPDTVVYNRSQVVEVTLLEDTVEAQLDPGYASRPSGTCKCCCRTGRRRRPRAHVPPDGRDRLSDYARVPEMFRYVETAERDSHREQRTHRGIPGDERGMTIER